MSRFWNSLSETTSYQDYKYVVQDSGSYGFGAGYSYAECLDNEYVPFKFRAIITHYICKDTLPETSIESHLYYMTPDMFSAKTYEELRCKVRLGITEYRHSPFSGKDKKVYRVKTVPVDELTGMSVEDKKSRNVRIMELIIPKLSLMGFSV